MIPLSFLARHFYQFERFEKQDSQDSQKSQNLQEYREPSSDTSGASGVSVEDAIFSTAHTMVLIGGWIMLFSILAKWVQTIPCFSPSIKAILGGIAEITTGIPLLCSAFSEENTLPDSRDRLCRLWWRIGNFSDAQCSSCQAKKCRIIHPALYPVEGTSCLARNGNSYFSSVVAS